MSRPEGAAARPPLWAVVAGGGTGGHLYPGLAVAEALVDGGVSAGAIRFVVSRRPLDAGTVAAAGFAATAICARGVQRRLTVANLAAGAALARGVWQCWGLLRRSAPRVVLAQGGYVSAACALAARLAGVPVVVLEANAVAGAANRLAARWAVACAAAFPSVALANVVVTGLPVRAAIAGRGPSGGDEAGCADRRRRARDRLGIDPGRRLVLVVGGSLGSARLNAAVSDACERLAGRGDIAVRHVLGPAAAASEARSGSEALGYEAVDYEEDMPSALAAADLVVSRAGGSVVAELAAAGRAALLVPLAQATGGHQSANAAAVADAGGAVVVAEAELDGERLAAEISALLADPERLAAMERAAAASAPPQAAERVADLLRSAAGGTP
ncbi:MAG: UDP-N-acetylglucosamine--N-acetylmuramyl-(pentapeptide) pyrophosphoryl-undecaprenol N-acetylglucosamine transferase [bacterium]|nr:UDP-N-acetylglucosamine--N-acetylmuramyl-(pentapeptide) pyrophosphoryl-undecaprenol N-acetylglucosamine transferase [bacterium]